MDVDELFDDRAEQLLRRARRLRSKADEIEETVAFWRQFIQDRDPSESAGLPRPTRSDSSGCTP